MMKSTVCWYMRFHPHVLVRHRAEKRLANHPAQKPAKPSPVFTGSATLCAKLPQLISLDEDADQPDKRRMNDDARHYAPAAARNRDPILRLLQQHLPRRGLVLEIASGSGEHIVHFAGASDPALTFQPSDADPAARRSIDAWTAALGLPNVRAAIAIDATSEYWAIPHADAVLCINMIHMAPWAATVGLMRGAARVLGSGGLLCISTVPSAATAEILRRAMSASTTTCAANIPRGACVTSRP
jgi:SAM-dependent methyltransferase